MLTTLLISYLETSAKDKNGKPWLLAPAAVIPSVGGLLFELRVSTSLMNHRSHHSLATV